MFKISENSISPMQSSREKNTTLYSQEKLNKLIATIEQVRTSCDGQLELPQICVIGDQSAGKSSLLASISGIPFPEGTGMCTRCPIVVRMDNNCSKKNIQ